MCQCYTQCSNAQVSACAVCVCARARACVRVRERRNIELTVWGKKRAHSPRRDLNLYLWDTCPSCFQLHHERGTACVSRNKHFRHCVRVCWGCNKTMWLQTKRLCSLATLITCLDSQPKEPVGSCRMTCINLFSNQPIIRGCLAVEFFSSVFWGESCWCVRTSHVLSAASGNCRSFCTQVDFVRQRSQAFVQQG